MKALKSLVPYFLIAALMWLFWLCNSNAERLPFVNIDLWAALFYLAPLLPLLMGGVVGRCWTGRWPLRCSCWGMARCCSGSSAPAG